MTKIISFFIRILVGLLYMFASSLFDFTIVIGVFVMSYYTGDALIKLIREDLNSNE